MKKCWCGLSHSRNSDEKSKLLAEAYHDVIQGAHPDAHWCEQVEKAFKDAAPASPAPSDAVVRAAKEALQEVVLQVERMNAAAIPSGEEFVEQYTINTGAFHLLLGMVRGGKVGMALAALSPATTPAQAEKDTSEI